MTIEIKGKEYKLALTTRQIVQLEKELKRNPLQVFMDIDNGGLPMVSDCLIIFKNMLTKYQHDYALVEVYELFDDFVEEGHNIFDLIPILIEVFKECGFIPKDTEEVKNV